MWIWEENKNWFHFFLFSSHPLNFFCYRNGIFSDTSSAVSLVLLRGIIGMVLTGFSIVWCALSASKLFVTSLSMDRQQILVAYPAALFYGVFALITIFWRTRELGRENCHIQFVVCWLPCSRCEDTNGKISFYILSSESVLRFLYIFYTVRWRHWNYQNENNNKRRRRNSRQLFSLVLCCRCRCRWGKSIFIFPHSWRCSTLLFFPERSTFLILVERRARENILQWRNNLLLCAVFFSPSEQASSSSQFRHHIYTLLMLL